LTRKTCFLTHAFSQISRNLAINLLVSAIGGLWG
jgi:hypothetical protein